MSGRSFPTEDLASISTWKRANRNTCWKSKVHDTGVGGIGYFSDAPTERGVKHLHELAQAAGGVSVHSSLCDPDGRHHRGEAVCWHHRSLASAGRSKSRRCEGAVPALPCRAGQSGNRGSGKCEKPHGGGTSMPFFDDRNDITQGNSGCRRQPGEPAVCGADLRLATI